ncbi:MAG: glycosyltransferase family 2 protein [Propionibacteriaceae bacterium]|jgi:glycosyltransferase involved in cell wall biosynthesis|nr:glycosyltransferase family 2 protein [Propionibacteriaceae bacterium]
MKIAAIVPAHNEELTIGSVVSDLLAAVPEMTVYVFDNCSTDRTVELARAAGATVRFERRKGKGNVVRRAFADLDADVYLMIDGDDTYDALAARTLIDHLLSEHLDQVVGVRTATQGDKDAYRRGHAAGNRFFNRLVTALFGVKVTDMLSGYRVFSRRFVKSFPALSRQFETETELTIHARNLRVPQAELPIGFRDRPAGSESKLRTVRDGLRILGLIVSLLLHERPALFFGVVAGLLAVISLGLGAPIVVEFFLTGLVPRFPTAILASAIGIIAVLCVGLGVMLNGILRVRQEIARLAYLQYGPVVSDTP